MTVDRADLSPILGRLRLDHERRGLLPSTIQKREICLVAFYRWCRDHETTWEEATAEQIQLFLDGRHLVARSRYTWTANLHCVYRWAQSEGLVDKDPTAKIIRPRLRRTLPRPIKSPDLAHAIELATEVMRAWLLLASLQGMRVGEIAGLRRSSVTFDNDLLRVRGKGDKERILPMHADVRRALLALPIRQRDRLWTRPMGGNYTPNNLSVLIGRFLRANGIDATAHQLRHWFGTAMYAATDHDIRAVQELMGHESPITTAVYADWTRGSAADAVRSLAVRRRTPGNVRQFARPS